VAVELKFEFENFCEQPVFSRNLNEARFESVSGAPLVRHARVTFANEFSHCHEIVQRVRESSFFSTEIARPLQGGVNVLVLDSDVLLSFSEASGHALVLKSSRPRIGHRK